MEQDLSLNNMNQHPGILQLYLLQQEFPEMSKVELAVHHRSDPTIHKKEKD
jgi:hypothetical protein